ncbi:uncharacterized protein LOC128193393 isoform X3 [Vigna angularis]|uniref:uncharacterized protein LOC128193393 isoform X3 n=1 Tax=Phaseolus angularis TaxID=3914 RepID=UPI0022B3BA57|nr:uncharacterized protein LOC128193393 isoform X3 [Vigna angularis]
MFLNLGKRYVLQALRRLKGNSDRKAKMSAETKVVFDQLTEDAMKLMENGEYKGYEKLARAKEGPSNQHLASGEASSTGEGDYDMFADEDDNSKPSTDENNTVSQSSSDAINSGTEGGALQNDYVYDESSGRITIGYCQRLGAHHLAVSIEKRTPIQQQARTLVQRAAQRTLGQRSEKARPARRGRSSRKWTLVQRAEIARPASGERSPRRLSPRGDARPARRGRSSSAQRRLRRGRSSSKWTLVQRAEIARPASGERSHRRLSPRGDAHPARSGRSSSAQRRLVHQVDARPASGRSSRKWTLVQ